MCYENWWLWADLQLFAIKREWCEGERAKIILKIAKDRSNYPPDSSEFIYIVKHPDIAKRQQSQRK